MTTPAQNASAGVYVSDDVGLEVTDGVQSRVQLGLLPIGTGLYGLRVLAADGTTVIIDGSSDMFKIAASGTQSSTTPANTYFNGTTTTLTALGANNTFTPAHLCHLSGNALATSTKVAGIALDVGTKDGASRFVASVSGGSPTLQREVFISLAYSDTHLDGSNQVVVGLSVNNANTAALDVFQRYYILQETAM